MPSNETAIAKSHIDKIGKIIGEQVDLDKLIDIAKTAGKVNGEIINTSSTKQDVRIAIAHDEAFGFYYSGDLQALRNAGAELVEFDAINDKHLPDNIDGLFIGGGFPEVRMDELSANTAMHESIRTAIENGLPTYVECGGLMYLCKRLIWNDKQATMVGAIPSDCLMHEKPQGRGYVKFSETDGMPWPWVSTDEKADEPVPAHEFHYSSISEPPADWPHTYAFDMHRGTGINGKKDGLVYKNLLACYLHQRDVSTNHWAERFVEFVRRNS